MQRIILHIDFDSFFASCEQEFNPDFRGKPLGVTATNGRTCIIASSKEAKKLGIKTGTRTYEALKIYPKIIFTPANFPKYLEISKKFLNICKDYSPIVEIFSIDEVFIDITRTTHLFGGVDGIINKIKRRVKNEIGEFITISIGISHNKLLAKLASSLKKPNGVSEIKKNDIEKVYKNAKLTDICGIGEKIKERLNKIGIYNLVQLRLIPSIKLIAEFGQCEANFLKNVAFANDFTPVIPYTNFQTVKSVGRNYCLPKNELDQRVILQNIYELCEEVAIKLRRLNKKARTIGLSLRGENNIHTRKTQKDHIDSGSEIFNICKKLYNEWKSLDPKKNMVRMISIWAENLEDKKNLPLNLFDFSNKKDRLIKTIDKINERFGDHTIRNGFLLHADKLTTVPNGYLADKYERFKITKI